MPIILPVFFWNVDDVPIVGRWLCMSLVVAVPSLFGASFIKEFSEPVEDLVGRQLEVILVCYYPTLLLSHEILREEQVISWNFQDKGGLASYLVGDCDVVTLSEYHIV